ncbi:MAG TPA: hypothetical protein VK524_19495, partial [Polyangiaceae bacterium]|nr:hypothetical protein [Polyangiaceae bacterium]
VYDETLRVLRSAVDRAKLGQGDKLSALERLDRQARELEATARGPEFDAYVRAERERSPELGGMSVFGPEKKPSGSVGPSDSVPCATRTGAERRRR